jgi:hypothetical protein
VLAQDDRIGSPVDVGNRRSVEFPRAAHNRRRAFQAGSTDLAGLIAELRARKLTHE